MDAQRWICILAGGEGSRLASYTQSLYDDGRPKQFCALDGPRTMIEKTLQRASILVPNQQIMVSLCQEHLRWRELLDDFPGYQLSTQPGNAGTGAGVLLSCMQIARVDPKAIVTLMPSDHWISDEQRWSAAIREAMEWVELHPQAFVVLGVEPDRPETEYGWLLPRGDRRAPRLARLEEKPNPHRAHQLFEEGALWNTMVTVFRCDEMLHSMRQLKPHWYGSLYRAMGRDDDAIGWVYENLNAFDLSRDIFEASPQKLRVFPARRVGWCDLGNEDRLKTVLKRQSGRPKIPCVATPRRHAASSESV